MKLEMPTENEIRDQLAGCLSLIEPGLELVDTNYMLRNPFGSDGYVDLLARDSSAAMVIIELKRADQSAREALHEIGKYADLLARDKGVPRHRIRTIIVSTTWRELLIPYSYYVHQAEIAIEGFELVIETSTGRPLSASFVEPIELPEDRSMTDSQRRIEIPSGTAPRQVWEEVTAVLSSSGAVDHAAALISDGTRHQVIVALGAVPDESHRVTLVDELLSGGTWTPEELEYYDDEPIQELAFLHAQQQLPDVVLHPSYPDKVAALLYSHGWFSTEVYRAGVFSDGEIYSDKALLDELDGSAVGLTDTRFDSIARPFNRPQWDNFLRGIHRVVTQEHPWRVPLDLWLNQVAARAGRTDVGAHIYDYGDLLQGLVHGLEKSPIEYLPSIAIAVQDQKAAVGVIGTLVWDGTPVDIRAALSAVYPDAATWADARQFGMEREFDDRLLRAWHLRHALWEKRANDEHPSALSVVGGELIRTSPTTDSFGRLSGSNRPFSEFFDRYQGELTRATFKLRKILVIDGDSAMQMHMLDMREQARWEW